MKPVDSSSRWWFIGIGVTAAVVGLLVGTIAAFADPNFSPLNVISGVAIDLPGAEVKSWVTQTFGTAAKSLVVVAVAIAVIVIAGVAGWLARTRLRLSVLIFVLAGLLGAGAALLRPNADLLATLPSLIAGIVAALALLFLVWLAARPKDTTTVADSPSLNRRSVLVGAASLLGVGAIGVVISRALYSERVAQISRAVTGLPKTFRALAPLPTSVQAPVPNMPPFITPNDEFYVIDTALVKPALSAAEWTLTIGGMVREPFTLTYPQLLELPMAEYDITLMCVSNPVGGEYISNARWLGTPLMPLLEKAGLEPAAEQLFSTSEDGWTCSTPIAGLAQRNPLLVVGMNGEPLPVAHGYPVRMVIPGLYGFISATKWLAKIEAATYAAMPAYWTQRGWATDAPVLTGSKIELPDFQLSAGVQPVAGTAWAMDGKGISKVELQIDGGEWLTTNLADVPNDTTWRQWWLPVDFQPGTHALAVRATNGEGELQTSELRDVVPSGATGYDTKTVQVSG